MHGHACAHTWTEHACTNTHKKGKGLLRNDFKQSSFLDISQLDLLKDGFGVPL